MKYNFTMAAVAFVIGAISGIVLSQWNAQQSSTASAQSAATAEAPSTTWLKGNTDEKLVQIERQLRGFDVTMAEVGYRYDELVDAAKSANWEYAQYQTEKIEHTIRLGLERRPKRANSAKPFLNDVIPSVLESIKARKAEELDVAVKNLHTGCIQCHRAENVLYMGGRFAAIHPTSEANAKAIMDDLRLMTPEYLAAADRSDGRLLFSKHCANCHRLFGEGSTTGPDLTNLQRSNVEYLLKTIVDPNALVGFDYQTVVVATNDGRVISGLVTQEDGKSLTIQTAEKSVTTPKNEIDERSHSNVSTMPEGLLQKLSNEQVRDLIGYLQGSDQAPLPAEKGDDDTEKAPPSGDNAGLRKEAQRLFGAIEAVPEAKLTEPAVTLGRDLFWDKRLSANGKVACASCHMPDDWGADARRFSSDAKGKNTARNSQTVFNAVLQPNLRWTGDRKSGAHQAERSLTGSMGFDAADDVVAVLKESGYEAAFKSAFPKDAQPVSPANYAAAIQAYEETLITPAPFDRFLAGEDDALDATQKTGLKLFLNSGCADCHEGPLLGGTSLEVFGVVKDYWTASKSEKRDAGLFEATKKEADLYKFRVSMLRNISKTAPYFHDGSVADLKEAVQVMADVQLGSRLSDADASAIVSFLDALTGELPKNYSPGAAAVNDDSEK